MRAEHLEILVEEPSMEAFLTALLPRLLTDGTTFKIITFQGKSDLLGKLESRLRAYAAWLPATHRIVIVVDRDDDDCVALKRRLEDCAAAAGLLSRTAANGRPWRVVTRIAVEELEAWYFGDWEAARQAYPRVKATVPAQAAYRDPDRIAGGTWEHFEKVLRDSGYYRSGLRKIEAARALGQRIDPVRNRSRSFVAFRDAILEAVG